MLFSLVDWLRLPETLEAGGVVPGDFFGINVATKADPATDDWLVARLRELGLRDVRCDVDAAGLGGHPGRLVERLEAEGFSVMVRLLQPVVATGDTAEWRGLLAGARERFSPASWEIGSVVNRRKWSGYTYARFLGAWRAAVEVLEGSAPLAGPNVSDFEPLHAYGLLARMAWSGRTPDVQTVNLFSERTRIPEAFDWRVLGRWAAPRLRLNLVKKARVFEHIGARFGVPETVCTHTCWNTFRLQRWAEGPEAVEAMRADLLERYVVLAAASGALRRVYWGPLVGWADGLVDDGTGGVAVGERVARHVVAPGAPAEWTVRPAFERYAEVIRKVTGTAYTRAELGADRAVVAFGEHVFEWTWA